MPHRNRVAGPRRKVARSRGAASGVLLVLLGAWGALIPLVGPYFNFSFTPDKAWTWTAARGWLEVLPGAATFIAGVLLLVSASRLVTLTGAWLAIAAGAWFVVGPQLATSLSIGSPGQPAGSGSGIRAAESLALFYGLGVVIVFLAAAAFGRLSLVSPRDVRAAEQREQLATQQAAADARPPVTDNDAPVAAPVASPAPTQGYDTDRDSVQPAATVPQPAQSAQSATVPQRGAHAYNSDRA
jgi:hypothetical protein